MPDPVTTQVASDPTALITAMSTLGYVLAKEIINFLRSLVAKRNGKNGNNNGKGDNPHVRYTTCETKVKDIYKKIDRVEHNLLDKFDQIAKKTGYNRTSIENLEVKIENLSDRLETYNVNLTNNIKERHEDIKDDISDIRSDIKDLRDRV